MAWKNAIIIPTTILMILIVSISLSSASNKNNLEKYSSLPPTVFAPDGRLYSVEHAAQRASDLQDTSSSTVIALHCTTTTTTTTTTRRDDHPTNHPGFIVLLSLGPCSPHLYYSDEFISDDIDDEKEKEKNENEIEENENEIEENENEIEENEKEKRIRIQRRKNNPVSSSLVVLENNSMNQLQQQPLKEYIREISYPKSPPISLLHSTHLLAATGGTAVDAAILLRRIQDISTTLYEEHDTMIGNEYYRFMPMGQSSSSSAIIRSHTLARYCADGIQIPTQTTGSKYGRILSSSALILGVHEPITMDFVGKCNDSSSSSSSYSQLSYYTHHIWRLDPTGQFWKVDAAMIGRGAGFLEEIFLRQVYKSLKSNNDKDDNHDDSQDKMDDFDFNYASHVSNHQVQSFLSNLSVEDALIMACRLLQSLPTKVSLNKRKENRVNLLERGLQAMVLGRKPLPEILTTKTLQKLVEVAAIQSLP